MSNALHRKTWDEYVRAWSNVTADERKALLQQAVSEECTFSNVVALGRGLQELTLVLEKFQKDSPGGYFETTDFIEQHAQSLAYWNLHDATRTVLLSGANYARYGQDGRLIHIAGFWKS
jgi:hypothetical protein